MFDAIKRWFNFGKRRAWLESQRVNLRQYLAQELGSAEGLQEKPAWTFEPYVALWTIPDGWAITDPVLALHVVGKNHVLRSARDAARYFGRRFRESAENARRNGQADIAEALANRSTALLSSVEQDEGWPDPVSAVASAESTARQALGNCLAAAESDPPFRQAVRVIHDEVAAPGGPFHALYFYLDFRPGRPIAPVFDALARQLTAIESRVALLVAWRVQYALVVFGINFGEPDRELEVERQADRMRARYSELSRNLDRYSPTGTYPLAMHFVDNQDVPFTAHPVVGVRAVGYEYKAEASFFDVRTHPFHQSLEKSGAVGMRLMAASIAPEFIHRARRAFAETSPHG
jgi:hypothetical protein